MITVSRYLCVTIVVERSPVQTATRRLFVIGKFSLCFQIYYYYLLSSFLSSSFLSPFSHRI